MSEKKNILWISHFLPYPPKGGSQMRSYNLIKQLSLHHNVFLLCIVDRRKIKPYFPEPDQGIEKAFVELSTICKDVRFCILEETGKFKKYFSLVKSILLWESYAVSLIKTAQIHDFITQANDRMYDWIHLDTVALVHYINLFGSERVCLNHHNIESDMMKRRAEQEPNIFKKLVYYFDAIKIRSGESKFAKKIDAHLVCSELDKLRLEKIVSAANIKVVENGINSEVEALENKVSIKKGALFIGGLDWYPNADAVKFILSEIWPVVRARDIGLQLDIVGKNPSSEIIRYSSSYPEVTLHGFVDDIDEFYRNKLFFLCPIRDGGGTKLKILEAMAHSIPILAHPVAMEGIEAVDGVHYFSAITAEDFANKIFEIMSTSNDVLQNMSANAKKLVREKYEYSEIGKRLSQVYV